MKMKRFLYFSLTFFGLLINTLSYAQIKNDSTIKKRADTSKIIKKKVPARAIPDTLRKRIIAQTDSLRKKKIDSSVVNIKTLNPKVTTPAAIPSMDTTNKIAEKDSFAAMTPSKDVRSITNDLLSKNKWINVKAEPVFFIQEQRTSSGKEFLFYAICAVVLILGIFKTFYRAYFNNLFRVFFNTSLRQSQLSEQLLQAKLPSFILNIFFTIAAGLYIWLLFGHFHPLTMISSKLLLPVCIAGIAILYFLKYCLLKFLGWLTEIRETTDNYIFVLFLVNKITGIVLVPFIILLAFSMPEWVNSVATISLLVLGLFFLSRYVKSYSVIQRKISLRPFHFIIYIAAAEIMPLFIIYKFMMDYLI